MDRFGRRTPLYVCLIGNLAFVFLEMFATSLEMLFAGATLNGVCYGFYFVIAPTYAAEVVPYHLRNISIAFTNMSLIGGQLIGQGATTGAQTLDTDMAYRIPFALR
jgi:MFS transporter, SP family, general alpha glucoside:H+ symporter